MRDEAHDGGRPHFPQVRRRLRQGCRTVLDPMLEARSAILLSHHRRRPHARQRPRARIQAQSRPLHHLLLPRLQIARMEDGKLSRHGQCEGGRQHRALPLPFHRRDRPLPPEGRARRPQRAGGGDPASSQGPRLVHRPPIPARPAERLEPRPRRRDRHGHGSARRRFAGSGPPARIRGRRAVRSLERAVPDERSLHGPRRLVPLPRHRDMVRAGADGDARLGEVDQDPGLIHMAGLLVHLPSTRPRQGVCR